MEVVHPLRLVAYVDIKYLWSLGGQASKSSLNPAESWRHVSQTGLERHRVMGSAEEGVKQFLNQVSWNPVKIRSKSLEIMILQRYKAYPEQAEKVDSG